MKKLITLILFAISLNSIGQIEYNGKYNLLLYRGSHMVTSLNDYYNYNDSAIVFFSRLPTKPSVYEKLAISRWYDSIQYYNIDDSLDCRYFFALKDSVNALIDWFNASRSITPVNNPDFQQYQGYLTNGSNNYLKLNYNPSSSTKLKLNNNSLSVNVLTNNYAATKWIYGIWDGTTYGFLSLRLSATQFMFYNHTGNYDVNHNSNVNAYITQSRIGNLLYIYKNGDTLVHRVNTPITRPNLSTGIYLGCVNQNGTASFHLANKYSCINVGGSLSDTQAKKLYRFDSILFTTIAPYDVYILLGQSNALGQGVIGETTTPYNAKTYKGYVAQHYNIEPIDPPNYNTYYPSFSLDYFGLENSFVNNISTTDKRILFIKYAVGGSVLSTHYPAGSWNPSVGTIYTNAVNHIDSIITFMINNHISYNLKGFMWFQGEADGTNATYAGNYQTNESSLITALRAKYGNLPFYSMTIHDYTGGVVTEALTINAAKTSNSSAISDYHLINTLDLTWKSDSLHLSTSGIINLGIRIANTIEP